MQLKNEFLPNIYLETIHLDDVNNTYVDWLNDPQINQYLETRFKQQTLASVATFVENILTNQNEKLFTIRTANENKHIGNIKLGSISQIHGVAYISLFIGNKNSWGKGYASQAIQLISEYAFDNLKLRKLSAGAYKPNIASTKAFLKAGYNYDGTLKDHYLLEDEPCDLVQVCLFNPKRCKNQNLKLSK